MYVTLSTLKLLYLHMKVIIEACESELGPIKVNSASMPTSGSFASIKEMLKSTPIS